MAFLRRSARPGRAGDVERGAGTLLALALCVSLLAAVVPAAGRGLSEVEVRAGFLYNFARFVEWPPGRLPDGEGPFVIVVLGDPDLARALDAGLAGKRLRGHPVVVRDARTLAGIEEAHLLWVGEDWKDHLPEVLGKVGHRPVLTVSGIPGFAGSGGIIELYRLGTKFRFSIDERAAGRHGLRVSSRLLTLARPRPAGAGGRGRR